MISIYNKSFLRSFVARSALLLASVVLIGGCQGGGGFKAAQELGPIPDPPPPPPPPGDDCLVAKVSWDAPTTLTNGQPIPAGYLVGYKLYHGLSAGAYTDEYVISDGATEYYEVPNLATQVEHYFAIRATSADGGISELSNEATFNKSVCQVVVLSFGTGK